LLFLDFDGTLAPLVEEPSQARLDEATRQTLAEISRHSRILTTIISGRSLHDICSRVGLEGMVYAGNHGLEICGRQLRFEDPAAAARREELAHLSKRLAMKLRDVEGAIVQFKGLTTSVHFRSAAPEDAARIEAVVKAAVASAPASFRVASNKMAFEIIPPTDWNKGKAVCWIEQHLGDGKAVSIYLGDDLTDENAFRALPEGITVKVGNNTATSARYWLTDPAAVREFLIWLAHHVTDWSV